MELIVLGASPAVQNPGGASSGYLLQQDETEILVDCGHGVVGVLGQVTSLSSLSAVVISHMHPDHIFDLVPLTYGFLFRHLAPIPLYLPPHGWQTLKSLEEAVGLGDHFFSDQFAIHSYDPSTPLTIGPVTIRFTETEHFIPAYAMRFDVDSRSLVYSSDTGWSKDVLALMRDANVAVVEATVPQYTTQHEAEGHLDAALAGKLAREAGVRQLVITHTWYADSTETLRLAAEAFEGPVVLARERERFEV